MIKLPPTSKRVKMNTKDTINQKILGMTRNSLETYLGADYSLRKQRIKELDHEWDTERVLETNFALIGITTSILGMFHNKKWFILGGLASGFLLLHSLQGWCPPLPVIRRLGFRTAEEISEEKAILKSLE